MNTENQPDVWDTLRDVVPLVRASLKANRNLATSRRARCRVGEAASALLKLSNELEHEGL